MSRAKRTKRRSDATSECLRTGPRCSIRNDDFKLTSTVEKWIIRNCAILGDSGTALCTSFGLVCLSWFLASSSLSRHIWWESISATNDLGPIPPIPPPFIYEVNGTEFNWTLVLSEEIHSAYQNHGVVAIRGLLTPKLMKQLSQASHSLLNPRPRRGTQFHTVSHGALFVHDAFWKIAIESKVPLAAQELLQSEVNTSRPASPRHSSLRVMRDIFLAKESEDSYICGWHVDDLGFWPATPDSPGINAWIAMEVDQSSFAVAVGSHQAPWRHQAYYETGSSMNFPKDGYANASDYLSRRTGSGTCNLKQSAPHLHRRMEETSLVYELQPGDVVFHTRWLFHRTVVRDVTDQPLKGRDSRVERRYSVRYGPGSSIIPPGYGAELSVLWNPSNGGRTADQVCQDDGPWYPQVWPLPLDQERLDKDDLVRTKFPVATERQKIVEREMTPLIRQMARERSRSLQN